jgi:glycosyltransferase involved in cell wall biosynthesis
MRIGVYARGLSGVGGVKQYIDAMCRALIRNLDDDDQLFIVHNNDYPYFARSKPNVEERVLPFRSRAVADFALAPRVLNGLSLDVAWFTKYVIPFGIKARCVTTVHDMAYFMPELGAYPLKDTLYMRNMIKRSLKRADRVIAVSNNTRADIQRIAGVPEEKLSVIFEAADRRYRKLRNKGALASFRERYGLPERYILFTGGISPRKNLLRLIHAFNAVAHRLDHQLVITGAKGWRDKKVLSAIEKHQRIIRTGFIEDEDMAMLYNAAHLFVYPSLYEGFGLPILEAQKCGCPVICSENSSLIEVGGDGVQFIEPTDVDELADAIWKVATDDDERQRLIKKGYDNARRFSWDKAAKALFALFRKVGVS